ncbi:MAG: SigB/SigF/SigG family RNA polymerase sigma factor [Clostridiaceae bacterium]|nr:SigB/SigF/SigG family RNA polymerase sigma factor [Clostridiaceae bacterium]
MKKVEITGIDTASLPKLSAKECEKLLHEINDGNEEAKQLFIRANMRLVLSIVGRFSRSQENADDLFQVGCVGLMKALNNFNTNAGVKFSTYAVPMIIGEIRRFLRDRTSIKVSRNIRDTAYKALKARENLMRNSNDGMPTLFEIAEEIDIPISEIACALDAISEPVSFFEPVYSDGEDAILLSDQVSDPKNNPEIWTENMELKEALKKIPERERNVLILRYYVGKTQIEISEIINISQAQVSRLEKNAVEKLRKLMQITV